MRQWLVIQYNEAVQRSARTLVQRTRLWTRFFLRATYPRDLPLMLQSFARRRYFAIPDETWRVVDPISGFLSAKEAGLLYWAAHEWPSSGPVIELGSFEGKSTIVFAKAGRHVYAIDAWALDVPDRSAFGDNLMTADDIFERFKHNLRAADVDTLVTIYRGRTSHVGCGWTTPGALLYVDAGHTYPDVSGDLDLWSKHLKPDGLLLMHDVLGDQFLDVTRAASELLTRHWRVVASSGSIVALSRRKVVPGEPVAP